MMQKKGTRLWYFNAGKQINSSPRIDSGLLYFGAVDGNIYALDAEKGNAVWFFPTNGPISSSPAVSNNIVYIGSLDNGLYALAGQLER